MTRTSAKPLAVALVLVLAGAAVALMLRLPGSDPLWQGSDLSETVVLAAVPAVSSADHQATGSATELPQRVPVPGPDKVVVTGRIVASESGLPLAGCRIAWSPLRFIGHTNPVRPAPAFSQADGRFELALLFVAKRAPISGPAPSFSGDVWISPGDHELREVSLVHVSGPALPGETVDMGDLRIRLREP